MIHELKIEQMYLYRILTGHKTFEVRENDRDYQVGDSIHFLPLISDVCNCYDVAGGKVIPHYLITYITDFGLKDNFVALGIKPSKETS